MRASVFSVLANGASIAYASWPMPARHLSAQARPHLSGRLWAATALWVLASVAASAQPSQTTSHAADVTLRIIVTSSADEADVVRQRLLQGEPFADVARDRSIDPTASHGGLIGRVAPDTLRPELRDAIVGLAPGQVSAAIRIPTGFAVLWVDRDSEPAATGSGLNAGIDAVGSVKYVLETSGLAEARAALNQYAKPDDWNQHPRVICDVRRASIDAMHRALAAHLSEGIGATDGASRRERMQTHSGIGLLYAYEGRLDDTLRHFQEAYTLASADSPDMRLFLEEAIGVSHLHKAVMENGVQEHPGDRSLITTTPSAAFEKRAHAEKAIEHFLRYLTARPDNLEVTWLLNLAYRATGGYPDAVPERYRIAQSAFASVEDIGRFRDVAAAIGLRSVASAGGVIVDDFDNDGSLDVVTSSMESCAPMRLFKRGPAGSFVEQAAAAGLADQLGGLNLLQADYDNDGCLDILLLRGGWDEPQRKSLLRNKCDGTFADVTVASGLALPVTSTQTAAWTDFNNDGFVDLFVGNENAVAQLFLNQRDGTFVDVAAGAGVARSAYIKAVAAGDFNNDGWPDLYASNFGGSNFLYRNNRDGTFTDVAIAAGAPGTGRGFGTWFFDFDNDGWQDIFATSYFLSLDETARTYLKRPHNAPTLKLYRNQRDGTFADVTRDVSLDKVFMPMGSNFGDVDNDGWLDIYLGTGSPSYGALVPSVLLRNQDGRTFGDVTSSSGTGELGKGHGVAFADLDNDGDDDIVFEVGGATPGDKHALRVFDNPGHGNNWLEVSLIGSTSNRSAFGARVTVTVQTPDGSSRELHRTIGSGGSFGASPLRQHIGIGKATRIQSLDVWWPTSRTRQHFSDVAINQWIQVTELDTTYSKRPRPPHPVTEGGTP